MQLANKAWANVRLPGAPPLPNVGSDRAGPVSGGQWGRDGRGPNEAADRAAAGVDPIHAVRHCAPAASQALVSSPPHFDVVYDTVSSFDPVDPDYEPTMRPLLKPLGR